MVKPLDEKIALATVKLSMLGRQINSENREFNKEENSDDYLENKTLEAKAKYILLRKEIENYFSDSKYEQLSEQRFFRIIDNKSIIPDYKKNKYLLN
ncbi:hypothetical protein ACFLTH_04275 [Bacteroidota bacterium]